MLVDYVRVYKQGFPAPDGAADAARSGDTGAMYRFFGVAAGSTDDARTLVATARKAESAGFAGLVLPDHLIEQHAPLPVLATVAAVTERLRVMPFVLNSGLRHPAVLAQDLATIDVLSGGRLEIGIGAGWNKAEHDAVGLPFDPPAVRTARLEETVAVLKGCFADQPFSYRGEFFTIDGHNGFPKPVQKPHPPVFIGGGGRRTLTLAAREADIVGLAPRIRPVASGMPPPDAHSVTIAAAEEKVAWVREAAGERFASLELNVYPSGGPLVITDNARSVAQDRADRLRQATGVELSATDILESPHVFIGTVDALVAKVHELRERLGVTSFMLGDVDEALPVVERLAG
ncbi:LLM class F420-dependent oxidoreductase [Virgisporangium ochraceum]|uniref:LLM class F420-dependent oxidoreductase n=2 Tax=Virgisporangium ochraceum TaxID=65505 RepID=A0A8J3ZSL7_9ACTN|nr:LLM class F420-dependent oxidoreductase [Virgisporangium ochraceum]